MRDDIEKIFTFYSDKSGIFARKDFLQSSYVPDKLPHREELVRQLAQMLAPSLKGEKPSNIFVYGKPGTGKTAAVTFVGSQLQGAAEGIVDRVPLGDGDHGCLGRRGRSRVLAVLDGSLVAPATANQDQTQTQEQN